MKDMRKWLRERAVDWWEWGDDDMAEWHECKSQNFLNTLLSTRGKPQRLSKSYERINPRNLRFLSFWKGP